MVVGSGRRNSDSSPLFAYPYGSSTAASSSVQLDLHRFWSDSTALLAALEGRPRAAARLVGYADAAYAARGTVRQPNEATARQRSDALARAALGDALFESLVAEGRQLRDEEVEVLAFARDDSA